MVIGKSGRIVTLPLQHLPRHVKINRPTASVDNIVYIITVNYHKWNLQFPNFRKHK